MEPKNKYDWEKTLSTGNITNDLGAVNTFYPGPNSVSVWPTSFQLPTSSVKNIATALLSAQKQIGAAVKDAKNPFFKSSYATLNSVMDACKGPLNNAGIVISQPVVSDTSGEYVETQLIHTESGEMLTSRMRLLAPKNMQDYGSAISYARRYSLQSLMFIYAEDDDGNASSQAKPFQPKEEVKVSSFRKTPQTQPVVEPPTTKTPESDVW